MIELLKKVIYIPQTSTSTPRKRAPLRTITADENNFIEHIQQNAKMIPSFRINGIRSHEELQVFLYKNKNETTDNDVIMIKEEKEEESEPMEEIEEFDEVDQLQVKSEKISKQSTRNMIRRMSGSPGMHQNENKGILYLFVCFALNLAQNRIN